ncbi:MAG: hypothetical protein JWM82_2100 [Myxococcales bacterium]|nr:hypothetical protein [Myxococcales bacterium]
MRVGVPIAVVAGAFALARAAAPHTFADGDVLRASDLNASFAALDQRIAALETKEPFTGTFPAVLGLGTGFDTGQPLDRGGTWFCGAAPDRLEVSSAPLVPGAAVTFSNAFGGVVFTNGGAASLNQDFPSNPCGAGQNVCAAPLTFFLVSPKAQTLVIRNALDDAGATYVDGARVAGPLGGFPNTTSIPIPAGAFALSFLACSTGGAGLPQATLAFVIYDRFLADATLGLTVDFDRTFHRNGR